MAFCVSQTASRRTSPRVRSRPSTLQGTAPGQGTVAYAINSEGAIAGQFQDAKGIYHGFLRSLSGQFTIFDIPGLKAGANQGTAGENINDAGEIAGIFADKKNGQHGFVRHADGTFETFNPPNSIATVVALESGLNLAGAVTGYFFDANLVIHGFVRSADGTITVFDSPLAGTGQFQGTIAAAINNDGEIAGGVTDSSNVYHGFVRLPDGFIETFEAPGSGATPGTFQGTFAVGIDAQGAVTAYTTDINNLSHGAVRYPDGRMRIFNVFAAGNGVGQGTTPQSISPAGCDSGILHGQ